MSQGKSILYTKRLYTADMQFYCLKIEFKVSSDLMSY